MIVPGGGLSEDGGRWISSQPGFLALVKVLSRLFRGRLLAMLAEAHTQDRLRFFGDHAALADKRAFKRFLAPLRRREWVVYTKEPFAGPEQVLRYLLIPPRQLQGLTAGSRIGHGASEQLTIGLGGFFRRNVCAVVDRYR